MDACTLITTKTTIIHFRTFKEKNLKWTNTCLKNQCLTQMLNTEILLQKYMEDLEKLAIPQCPGIGTGRLFIRGEKQQKFWRNSIKLSKKFLIFLCNRTASGTVTSNLFPLTQFRLLKKGKQRRLLWTQAFVKSCNKSFWSLH